jgi:soluble lytic murein transglycosylase
MRKLENGLILLIILSLMGCSPPMVNLEPSSSRTPTPPANSSTVFKPSPIATLTPTPPPGSHIINGDQARIDGDYSLARQEYQTAYSTTSDPQVQAASLWGLGQVEYLNGYYDRSLNYLNELVSNFPNSYQRRLVFFLFGKNYDALKLYSQAAESYSTYLSENPGRIDSYVQELLGNSLVNNGNYAGALDAYKAALQAPRLDSAVPIEIKMAGVFTSLGDISSSLQIYNDIALRTTDDYYKAQMDFLIGQIYINQGQPELAYPFFQDTVAKYPAYFDSYSALVALVEAGIPVNDLDRGLVDYFSGHYGVALVAFNRYLLDNPGHDGTVLYYMALTMRENGEYQQAIDTWSLLIDNYPENRFWESAWDERAYTLWGYLDDYTGAAQSFVDFVTTFPTKDNAPYYLNSAARIQERDGQLEAASSTWQRLAEQYPDSDLAPDALFNAGIGLYRLAGYDRALVVFQKNLIFSSLPSEQARAYLWIGKTQLALSDIPSSQQSYQLAAGLDPTGYYSERARDIILGRLIFERLPSYDLNFDISGERNEAEAWIRITFNLDPSTDLTGIGNLSSDARFQRGTEFLELGLLNEARSEFEDLRLSVAENSIDSYRLMNHLYEKGLYRIAIATSRQLLKLAGLETYTQMLVAPTLFNHINYGAYFPELVIPVAQEFDFDPLLLFSIIAQESSFEGFVHSDAGARGLMQIMPATGQSIVENIGWPLDYTSEDLYRPNVNIRLGASYLASNWITFNGDWFPILAAYNAGPGNAQIWNELSGTDPDLMLEVIRYDETRNYISHIFEIFHIYRSIYGNSP